MAPLRQIITGDVPFAHLKNEVAFLIAILQRDERPPKTPLESPIGASYLTLWEVAEACWTKNPKERMTIRAAFQRLQDDPSLL